MVDPYGRHTIRVRTRRRRALASRFRHVFSWATQRARAASAPFKVGDYVAGDDPFNGCQEGVVSVINGSSIGLRTAAPRRGTVPFGGAVVYYDHRQLRKPW